MALNFNLNDSFASLSPPTPPDGCTQCGICLPSCPTFSKSRDPEQSPMGRIRLMRILEKSNGEDLAPEQINKLQSCLGCYSCESVCPSKVSFGKLLDEALARKQHPTPRITRIMLWLAVRPSLLKQGIHFSNLKPILLFRAFLEKLGVLKFIGLQRANALLGKLTATGPLTTPFHQKNKKQRIALFTGCFSSVMEQSIHQATIDVFSALDHEVVIPKDQTCCGALHRHNGELETAVKLARNNIKAFAREKTEAILTGSSGCGASMKQYCTWLDDDELSMPVMDVSHYLANTLRDKSLKFDQLPLKVILHSPCTLRQIENQQEAVIELLQMIPGLELIPLPDEPRCCGAGGSHMLTQPEMADALRNDIINNIKALHADVLVSSNLGCAMHLKNGLLQSGIAIPLLHPVELIAQAMSVNNISQYQ